MFYIFFVLLSMSLLFLLFDTLTHNKSTNRRGMSNPRNFYLLRFSMCRASRASLILWTWWVREPSSSASSSASTTSLVDASCSHQIPLHFPPSYSSPLVSKLEAREMNDHLQRETNNHNKRSTSKSRDEQPLTKSNSNRGNLIISILVSLWSSLS